MFHFFPSWIGSGSNNLILNPDPIRICDTTPNAPENGPLVGPLTYEEDAPPDEWGGVGGHAVDAGEALLLQQLILRHQAVLQEIGTVAVRPLHTATQIVRSVICPQLKKNI
jgi:hypothetical protein